MNFIFGMGPLFASTPALDAYALSQVIGEYPEYLLDAEGRFSLEEALQGSWKVSPKKTAAFGWTSDIVWLSSEFIIKEDKKYILEVGYPLLDRVDLWVFRDGALLRTYLFGDQVANGSDAIDEIDPAIELPAEAGHYRLVFRIKTTSSVQVPLLVYTSKEFSRKESEEFFATGAYAGILLIMATYNLFIFFASRNLSYLYYSCFVSSFLLFQNCISGHATYYLWPHSPHWTDSTLVASGLLSSIFVVLFADRYLGISKAGIKRRWYIRAVLSVPFFVLLCMPLTSYRQSVELMGGSACVAISVFGIALFQMFQGQREARFYCGAWAALVIGAFFYIGKQFGILPINSFTKYSFKIGSVIEIALLSLALADQLAELRRKLSHALKDQIAHLKLQEKIAHDHEMHEKNLRFQSELRLNLASSVAHRINNPLNYIHLGVDNIRRLTQRVEHKVSVIFGAGPAEDPEVRVLQESFQDVLSQISDNIQLIDSGVEKASFTVKEVKVLSGVERATLQYYSLSVIWATSLDRLREIFPPQHFGRLQITGLEDSEAKVLSNIFILKCALEMLVLRLMEHETGTCSISNHYSSDGIWSISCPIEVPITPAFLKSLELNLDNILGLGQLRAELALENSILSVKIVALPPAAASLSAEDSQLTEPLLKAS